VRGFSAFFYAQGKTAVFKNRIFQFGLQEKIQFLKTEKNRKANGKKPRF